MARSEVRGTFSQPGPSCPAAAGRLAPTLGHTTARIRLPPALEYQNRRPIPRKCVVSFVSAKSQSNNLAECRQVGRSWPSAGELLQALGNQQTFFMQNSRQNAGFAQMRRVKATFLPRTQVSRYRRHQLGASRAALGSRPTPPTRGLSTRCGLTSRSSGAPTACRQGPG